MSPKKKEEVEEQDEQSHPGSVILIHEEVVVPLDGLIGAVKITVDEMEALHKISFADKKHKERKVRLAYLGTNKKGTKHILRPIGQHGQQVTESDWVVKVPAEFSNLLLAYYGKYHGTVDSIPENFIVPTSAIDVHIKVSRPSPTPQFISNIEANLNALQHKISSSGKARRIFIYGPSGSGRTTLSRRAMSLFGMPWVSISPKWSTIPFEVAMDAARSVASVGAERGFGIVFDDIDEMLLSYMPPQMGPNEDGQKSAQSPTALSFYYLILEIMKDFPGPIVFTSGGNAPIDHVISACDCFFSLATDYDDRVEQWKLLCESSEEVTSMIGQEDISISLMRALIEQATLLAKMRKKKAPSDNDIKEALRCFGKRDNSKQAGFFVPQPVEVKGQK